MPYTPTTWVNGTTAVNATNMNHIETYLGTINSAATDANISANGSGVETVVGLIAGSSGLTENGPLLLPYPSTQTLATGGTINLNTGPLIVVTCSANVTGIIMAAGTSAGQVVFVYNVSGSGVTFAASGSRVRNGSNITITSGRLSIMVWDGSNWTTCP
jgi:hypothetical protein